MNDFAEEALTDEHMQRLQHDSELGCQSRYAGAGEESGGIEAYAAPASESCEDEAQRKWPLEDVPLWDNEGQPINLQAAAEDALEWLYLLRRIILSKGAKKIISFRKEDARRLEKAIVALRRFGVEDAQ